MSSSATGSGAVSSLLLAYPPADPDAVLVETCDMISKERR